MFHPIFTLKLFSEFETFVLHQKYSIEHFGLNSEKKHHWSWQASREIGKFCLK